MVGWWLALAVAGPVVPVQGLVSDTASPNGASSVTFRLYTAASGGAAAYTETQTVTFAQGAFATLLGASPGFSDTFFRDNPSLYLSVEVGGAESARAPVGAVPFASYARYAGDAATLSGDGPSAFRRSNVLIPWNQLDAATIPSLGLTYTASGGISLSGTQFSLSPASAGALPYDTEAEVLGVLNGTTSRNTGVVGFLTAAITNLTATAATLTSATIPTLTATDATVTNLTTSGIARANQGLVVGAAADNACVAGTKGLVRWNDTVTALQVCNGTTWVAVGGGADGSTAANAAASCKAILDAGFSRGSMLYWVDPDGIGSVAPFQAWCDMTTRGGGWTMLMRIEGTTTQHVTNNAAFGPTPCRPDSTTCKVATDTISKFIAHAGVQIFEIRPDNVSYIPWYARADADTQVWPANLECSNRANLIASATTAWVLTSYQTHTAALAGTGGDLSDYSGANHYFPTPYADQQMFFKGSGTGLRANSAWSAACCNDDQPGTLWVR